MSSLSDPQQADLSIQSRSANDRKQFTVEQPRDSGHVQGAHRRYPIKGLVSLRILVIDNEEIYFKGLSAALASSPRVDVLGPVRSGRDALDYARRTEPNLAVISTSIPWERGGTRPATAVDLIPPLIQTFPHLIILPFYRPGEEHVAAKMLKLGAHAKIARDISEERLRDVFFRFCEGAPVLLPPPAINSLPDLGDTHSSVEPLTKRQHQILPLLAEGLTDAGIASRLGLSVGTARKHTENIRTRLDVNSRTAAVTKARKLGWL